MFKKQYKVIRLEDPQMGNKLDSALTEGFRISVTREDYLVLEKSPWYFPPETLTLLSSFLAIIANILARKNDRSKS